MSASLAVWVPLVLLGLVTALGFIGCALETGGVPNPLGPYEGDTVLKDPSVVALWPLNDVTGSMTAADIAPKQPPLLPFNGTYNGAVKLAQPGIVPQDKPNQMLSNCTFFNGGFVDVGFQKDLNTSAFTVEAWVKPNWTAADPQVQRAVVVCANTAAGAGYALVATPDNFWSAQIGIGSGNFQPLQSDQPIALINTTYLAMTFDGINTLSLFVGPIDLPLIQKMIPLPAGAGFLPEQGDPPVTSTSLFIGSGRPDLPGGMFPFNGFIQDVAYYGSALSFDTLKEHFNAGTSPG